MADHVFLIKGPRRTARLHLDGPFFVIGRGEPFPIFHDDPSLSREHAAVVETEEGYRLKDLGSRNGVLLNGKRLDRYAEVLLRAGDVFQAGATLVQLVDVKTLEGRAAPAGKLEEGDPPAEAPLLVDGSGPVGGDPDGAPTGDEVDDEGDGEQTLVLDDPDAEATVESRGQPEPALSDPPAPSGETEPGSDADAESDAEDEGDAEVEGDPDGEPERVLE